MARKRMIDPSVWTDEGMAELTPRQQLLYIGLFSNADDDGRMKCSPSALRLALPTVYAGIDLAEIGTDLHAVCAVMRQIVTYCVDGREYLAFRNYRKWQRIDKPSGSVLPPPPDDSTNDPIVFVESSENDPLAVPPSIVKVKRREEKVGEGETRADAPPANDPIPIQRANRADRETRIPPDFAISDDMRHWARDKVPGLDLDYAHDEFVSFWRGDGGKKLDWEQTWRNGMLKANERLRHSAPRYISQAEINKGVRGKFVGA